MNIYAVVCAYRDVAIPPVKSESLVDAHPGRAYESGKIGLRQSKGYLESAIGSGLAVFPGEGQELAG